MVPPQCRQRSGAARRGTFGTSTGRRRRRADLSAQPPSVPKTNHRYRRHPTRTVWSPLTVAGMSVLVAPLPLVASSPASGRPLLHRRRRRLISAAPVTSSPTKPGGTPSSRRLVAHVGTCTSLYFGQCNQAGEPAHSPQKSLYRYSLHEPTILTRKASLRRPAQRDTRDIDIAGLARNATGVARKADRASNPLPDA